MARDFDDRWTSSLVCLFVWLFVSNEIVSFIVEKNSTGWKKKKEEIILIYMFYINISL